MCIGGGGASGVGAFVRVGVYTWYSAVIAGVTRMQKYM